MTKKETPDVRRQYIALFHHVRLVDINNQINQSNLCESCIGKPTKFTFRDGHICDF